MLPRKPSDGARSHQPQPRAQGCDAATLAMPLPPITLRTTGAPSIYSTVELSLGSLTMAR